MNKHLLAFLLVPILAAFTWIVPTSQPASASAVQPTPVPPQGAWTTRSTGALGDFTVPPGDYVIDLATTGIYDPVQWCVYLDFKKLTVPAGSTVRFLNHPTRAPVVIRCADLVTIDGIIELSGTAGQTNPGTRSYAEPGPGGFYGGRGGIAGNPQSSAGHGPGGGFLWAGGGTGANLGGSASHTSQGYSYIWSGVSGPTYDVPNTIPLVGGSGGAAGYSPPGSSAGGGAGGGAILIGSDGEIRISGQLLANGGYYGEGAGSADGGAGSGGTIRIAAPIVSIAPTAILRAQSDGNWGLGRIRVDALANPGTYNAIPAGVFYPLGDFLPEPSVSAHLTLHSWRETFGGPDHPIGQDPQARILPATAADVPLPTIGNKVVRIEGRRIPLGTTLEVRLTYTEGQAQVFPVPMGNAGGNYDLSYSDITLDFASGVSAVQVLARL